MIAESAKISSVARDYVRKETFLAYYPRRQKLAVAGFLLCALGGMWVFSSLDKTSLLAGHKQEAAVQRSSGGDHAIHSEISSQPIIRHDTGQPLDVNAVAINDMDDGSARMAPAPVAAVTEDGPEGALPKIGENGQKPWQVYARPFNPNDKRPRVAIVIADLGLSKGATDAALRRLPSPVTMTFDVQSPVVASWLSRARQDGHETLLALPMEPFDYPRSDPGPNALLTNLPNTEILRRINWALRQGTGYIGITTLSGSRFATNPAKTNVLLEALKQRGLMVFDSRVSPHSVLKDMAKKNGVPVAENTLYLDKDPSPAAIDAALRQLEQTAQIEGRAVGIASPLPVTLDKLETWIKQLPSHGIALAPVSAVVE